METGSSFSRNLSKLRKEKKISQRAVAGALGVSQALLSHYENGIREPGLDFLVRAAEYYSCSVDYLLGRTSDRRGVGVIYGNVDADFFTAPETREFTAAKKKISKALSLVSELVKTTENDEYLFLVNRYVELCIYKIFRAFCKYCKNPDLFFSNSLDSAGPLSDSLVKMVESKLYSMGPDKAHPLPSLEYDMIADKYPVHWHALLSMIQNVDTEISALFPVINRPSKGTGQHRENNG